MLGANIKTFALITNTLAKDKEIEDKWRRYALPISARNLSNRVEDEVVDALVVRGAPGEIAAALEARYAGTVDRVGLSMGVKFNDAELLGMPVIVVVGRGLADGVIELKDRRSGDRRDIALADAVGEIGALLAVLP